VTGASSRGLDRLWHAAEARPFIPTLDLARLAVALDHSTINYFYRVTFIEFKCFTFISSFSTYLALASATNQIAS